MLSRRFFVACGLCAAGGFAATEANAQAAPGGLKRTVLSKTDGPAAGYETLIVMVEADANFVIPRHTHPGIESTYVLEGELTLKVDGQADRVLKPGEAFQVPAVTIHGGASGAKPIKLLANYMVEKGKPLSSPA